MFIVERFNVNYETKLETEADIICQGLPIGSCIKICKMKNPRRWRGFDKPNFIEKATIFILNPYPYIAPMNL